MVRSESQVKNDHDDCKEDLMMITHIRGKHPSDTSKLVEIERENEDTKRFHRLQQQAFLAELDQMCSPLHRSLDHLGQTFSCSKCDPRMALLARVPVEANLELRGHINFVKPDAFNHGRFEYQLLFSGLSKYLPLDRMRDDAFQRTRKLISKVNVHNGAVAKLATLRLQQLYSRQAVAWVTPFDQTQPLVYLPLHCVVKTASSCSTQARICIAPNVQYNTEVGSISYNSSLKSISSTQPRFYRFLLQHQTALCFAVADISQQFNRCHFTYNSSLQNITLCLKSKRGFPTYHKADCDDFSLYPLRHKVCGFGGKQTPQVAQYCQQSSVKAFKDHYSPLTKKDEFLTRAVDTILKQDCWMDDMFIYVGISILFEWLHVCGLSQPTLSESSEPRHLDTFMAEVTNHAEQPQFQCRTTAHHCLCSFDKDFAVFRFSTQNV